MYKSTTQLPQKCYNLGFTSTYFNVLQISLLLRGILSQFRVLPFSSGIFEWVPGLIICPIYDKLYQVLILRVPTGWQKCHPLSFLILNLITLSNVFTRIESSRKLSLISVVILSTFQVFGAKIVCVQSL